VVRCIGLNSAGGLGLVSVAAFDQFGRANMSGMIEPGNPSGTQCLDTANPYRSTRGRVTLPAPPNVDGHAPAAECQAAQ
jgi:hypothetical protein